MGHTLHIALIQSSLSWEQPAINRQCFDKKLSNLDLVDLVILPEMFNSGFTMHPETIAESMLGVTHLWMIDWAKKLNAAITGSIVIKENNLYYNRLLFVLPDGITYCYDKRHTFTLAGEDRVYQRGRDRLTISFLDWRICPLICYDLRFPVWSRNTDNYDLLCYVANWPIPRIQAWDILLPARAIENMAFCAAVNRVGEDVNGNLYCGHSGIWDALGKPVSRTMLEEETIIHAVIDKKELQETRSKLKFLEDQDRFNLLA